MRAVCLTHIFIYLLCVCMEYITIYVVFCRLKCCQFLVKLLQNRRIHVFGQTDWQPQFDIRLADNHIYLLLLDITNVQEHQGAQKLMEI